MLIGLVGCGGFGREVMPILRETLARADLRATVVFVVTESPSVAAVNGHPVLSEKEFFQRQDDDKFFNVAIADSQVREKIAERFIEAGARPIAIRSLQTSIYDGNEIGEGAIFCGGGILTSNSTIGRFFHFHYQCFIGHDCVLGDFVTFGPKATCNGNVVVEDHGYVGAGAIIRQGTPQRPLRIGRGAIVGMGAVVTKDVPAGETWVGNPARRLTPRR